MKRYFALFSIAFCVRLATLYNFQVDPIAPGTDMAGYYQDAILLLRGEWPPPTPLSYHPLLPILSAGAIRLLGPSPQSPRLLNCFIGALACLFLAAACETLFGRRIGLLTGYLLAFYRAGVLYSTSILDVPFTTLVLAVALWTAVRPIPHRGIIAGLVLFLGILARGTLLALSVVLVSWLWAHRERCTATAVAVPLCLCLLLIIARNAYYGTPTILASDTLNLWIGNNPKASGTYNIYPNGPAWENFLQVRQAGYSWSSQVVDFIISHPLDWFLLTCRKVAFWLFIPDEAFPGMVNPRTNPPRYPALFWILPGYEAFFVSAVAYLVVNRKSLGHLGLLAVVYSAYSLATVVFFISDRFRVPMAVTFAPVAALFICDVALRYHSARGGSRRGTN